jgi:signal transduction histidine kinase
MTLRVRLLAYFVALAALLIALTIWMMQNQTANLEFVPNLAGSTPTNPSNTATPYSSLPQPATRTDNATTSSQAASTNTGRSSLDVPPAVPQPKLEPVALAPKAVTLLQLQTKREPSLLRYSAGSLEPLEVGRLNQQSIWLWAVALLSLALMLGGIGIRRSLLPLETFANQIATRHAGRLERLEPSELPELKPAVSAVNGLIEDLRQSLERAKLQEQSAKRFAFNASHELRNPLTAAKNYLEILERHPSEPHAIRQALDAVQRTEKMLDSLLTLARLEGRGRVQGQPVVLQDFLEANFELPVFGEAVVSAERDLLELALENLYKNAQAHGGGAKRFVLEPQADVVLEPQADVVLEPQADVVLDNQTGLVWIWLEDAGAGFLPSLLPEAFLPFVKRGHGTGLGLAIVAAVAEIHGGRVKAENLPQGGARVGIALPV